MGPGQPHPTVPCARGSDQDAELTGEHGGGRAEQARVLVELGEFHSRLAGDLGERPASDRGLDLVAQLVSSADYLAVQDEQRQ